MHKLNTDSYWMKFPLFIFYETKVCEIADLFLPLHTMLGKQTTHCPLQVYTLLYYKELSRIQRNFSFFAFFSVLCLVVCKILLHTQAHRQSI